MAGNDFRAGQRRLGEQMRSVERLLGARRMDTVVRLQRLRFGQPLTLHLVSGETARGGFRGCSGVKIFLTDGRSFPLATVRHFDYHGG